MQRDTGCQPIGRERGGGAHPCHFPAKVRCGADEGQMMDWPRARRRHRHTRAHTHAHTHRHTKALTYLCLEIDCTNKRLLGGHICQALLLSDQTIEEQNQQHEYTLYCLHTTVHRVADCTALCSWCPNFNNRRIKSSECRKRMTLWYGYVSLSLMLSLSLSLSRSLSFSLFAASPSAHQALVVSGQSMSPPTPSPTLLCTHPSSEILYNPRGQSYQRN